MDQDEINRVFMFNRNLSSFDESLKNARYYIDQTPDGDIDGDSQIKLGDLKNELKKIMPEQASHRYDVTPGGALPLGSHMGMCHVHDPTFSHRFLVPVTPNSQFSPKKLKSSPIGLNKSSHKSSKLPLPLRSFFSINVPRAMNDLNIVHRDLVFGVGGMFSDSGDVLSFCSITAAVSVISLFANSYVT